MLDLSVQLSFLILYSVRIWHRDGTVCQAADHLEMRELRLIRVLDHCARLEGVHLERDTRRCVLA